MSPTNLAELLSVIIVGRPVAFVRVRAIVVTTPQLSASGRTYLPRSLTTLTRCRGPVAGFSKLAEARVQECENAIAYLLQLEGVQNALHSAPVSYPNIPKFYSYH
jgi:hypothetical protein